MDAEQVKAIAELEVRRYFDHYLEDVFPVQVAAVMDAHNKATDAHGGVLEQFKTVRWILIGAAFASGFGLEKFLSVFH